MKPFDKDAMRQALSQMREMLPEFAEHAAMQAQFTRMKYNALLKEGFTENQAIELCKTGSNFS